MTTEVRIRELEGSDIGSGLKEMLLGMWVMHADSSSHLISKEKLLSMDMDGYLEKCIVDSNQRGYVAVTDSRVVGLIRCEVKKLPEFYVTDKELYVDDLVVHEDYRKQGVATELIEAVKEFGKSNGIKLLRTAVYLFNEKSRKLFLKNGFKEDYCFMSLEN